MMSKHTPGPWKAEQCDIYGDDSTRWSVLTAEYQQDFFIASIENGAPGDCLDTEAANARLIAAAPDLLEACQAMLDGYEAGKSIPAFDVRELCRAAIAKVTGQAG